MLSVVYLIAKFYHKSLTIRMTDNGWTELKLILQEALFSAGSIKMKLPRNVQK